MLIRPFWLSLQHDGREEQQQRQEVCAVNATEIWKRTTTPKTNKQTNKQKQKQKRRKSKRTKRASESKWRRSRSVCKMLSIPPPPPLSSSSSSSTHRSHSLFLSLSLCLSLSLSVCFCISYFRTKKKFYLFYFSQTKKNKLYLSTSGRFTGRTSNTRKPEKEFMNRSLLPWNGSWLL